MDAHSVQYGVFCVSAVCILSLLYEFCSKKSNMQLFLLASLMKPIERKLHNDESN